MYTEFDYPPIPRTLDEIIEELDALGLLDPITDEDYYNPQDYDEELPF